MYWTAPLLYAGARHLLLRMISSAASPVTSPVLTFSIIDRLAVAFGPKVDFSEGIDRVSSLRGALYLGFVPYVRALSLSSFSNFGDARGKPSAFLFLFSSSISF